MGNTYFMSSFFQKLSKKLLEIYVHVPLALSSHLKIHLLGPRFLGLASRVCVREHVRCATRVDGDQFAANIGPVHALLRAGASMQRYARDP